MSSLQVMNTLIIFSSTNDSGLVERGSSCLQDSLEQIPTNGRAVASLKKVAVAWKILLGNFRNNFLIK